MKTKIIIIISILLILTINVSAITVEYTPLKETNNYWELVNLIEEYTVKKEEVHLVADKARMIGYTENSQPIISAKSQWHFYNEIIKFYQKCNCQHSCEGNITLRILHVPLNLLNCVF